MIVRQAPPEHYRWISERASLVIGSEFRALEAVSGERIVGMVGFDGWTPNAVSMHVALDSPAAMRALLRPAFGLVFERPPRGVGRNVVNGTVLSTNEKALKLDRHLGFKEVGRLRDAWDRGVDLVLLQMRREDCRFIPAEVREAA